MMPVLPMARVELTVNGSKRAVEAPPQESLLSVLRNRLGLTGTKYGCGEGQCGACTVLLDGRATKSCTLLAAQCDGARVTTIEGLSTPPELISASDARACGVITRRFRGLRRSRIS